MKKPATTLTPIALAEREKRVLVTLVDGRLALVIPHSIIRTDDASDEELAKLIARISDAVSTALSD
jgi:hypothetical protein